MAIPFEDAKRKKERGQTNEEFLDWIKKEVIDFKEIAIVVRNQSDVVTTYYSQNETLSLLGALEVAKQQIIESMQV
ncbi:hypothetical protein [Jeotgalibaca porci]|uniref:hypothetical protein n=1 Tax=Jeotgalibaca porci TaxID=1868793 RepID=UPI0035A16D81